MKPHLATEQGDGKLKYLVCHLVLLKIIFFDLGKFLLSHLVDNSNMS